MSVTALSDIDSASDSRKNGAMEVDLKKSYQAELKEPPQIKIRMCLPEIKLTL